MKRIAVFGATGSIGTSAAEILAAHRDDFDVVLLAARRKGRELLAQARRLGARRILLEDSAAAAEISREAAQAGVKVEAGAEAFARAAGESGIDLVLNAVVGAAGARVTLSALAAGHDVALANKESLVIAGDLVTPLLAPGGPRLFPVDSEHASARVLMKGRDVREVKRLILTASGGPFRDRDRTTFDAITPREALNHPTWDMGPRITIDSATLANKGFEVIEAMHLFSLPLEKIEIVIHPQSIVHAMIETTGGTVLAELAPPDMKLPIRTALLDGGDPAPSAGLLAPLVLEGLHIDFEAPRREDFPCLDLAYAAAQAGGTAPAVLNAADEIAVAAFLEGRIRFPEIPRVIERTLAGHETARVESFETVLAADAWARARAAREIGEKVGA